MASDALGEEGMVFRQLTDYGCPECVGLVQWELDCPGYKQGESVTVCRPVCGNAFLLSCSAKCGWALRVPTNNRASGRGTVPKWLDSFLSEFKERHDDD